MELDAPITWGGLENYLSAGLPQFTWPPGPLNTTWSLGLYVNNLAIVASTVLADLVEASFGGYAPVVLQYQNTAVLNSAIPLAFQTLQTVTIHNTGVTTQTVYGWFLKGLFYLPPLDKLITGSLFDAPQVLSPGQSLLVFPPISQDYSRYNQG
jgi:hypothetical protein